MRFANMEEGLDKIKWSLQYIFACVTYHDYTTVTEENMFCSSYKEPSCVCVCVCVCKREMEKIFDQKHKSKSNTLPSNMLDCLRPCNFILKHKWIVINSKF